MKKAIASGLIGLIALGGGVAVAAPGAIAQVDEGDTARQEMRAEKRAQRVETLTDVLGITAEDLQAAKESGQSIADIAVAQGLDAQAVIDALVADAQARIDAKLEAGEIDAERAAAKAEKVEERITARVNGEGPERGERGERGPRGTRGAAASVEAGV